MFILILVIMTNVSNTPHTVRYNVWCMNLLKSLIFNLIDLQENGVMLKFSGICPKLFSFTI